MPGLTDSDYIMVIVELMKQLKMPKDIDWAAVGAPQGITARAARERFGAWLKKNGVTGGTKQVTLKKPESSGAARKKSSGVKKATSVKGKKRKTLDSDGDSEEEDVQGAPWENPSDAELEAVTDDEDDELEVKPVITTKATVDPAPRTSKKVKQESRSVPKFGQPSLGVQQSGGFYENPFKQAGYRAHDNYFMSGGAGPGPATAYGNFPAAGFGSLGTGGVGIYGEGSYAIGEYGSGVSGASGAADYDGLRYGGTLDGGRANTLNDRHLSRAKKQKQLGGYVYEDEEEES